jgi:hypothetical protein
MSSVKYIEIGCDICGCGEHFQECSRAEADRQFRESGGRICKGKHICSDSCNNIYKAGLSNCGTQTT